MEANFQNQGIEDRLWNYIDGLSAPSEKAVVEELINKDSAWKVKYDELLQLNELIQSSELDAPSMRFTKNVMEEISKFHIAPATRTYINKKIIWSIGLFFIIMFVGFLVYGFGQMDWSTETNDTLTEQLNKVDISKFFSNTWINVFMMINVVLGLVFLDHYLGRKKNEFQKQRN